MAAANALYKDKYCKIKKGRMKVYWYYFPTTKTKTVNVTDIQGVWFKEQEFCKDFFATKDWGMSINPVWWACDLKRHWRKSSGLFNVVLDVGSSIKVGFSVENINDFLNSLRMLLPPNIPVVHGLPY